jgi:endonuclease YncB( thermonuclease family)
MSTPRFFRDPPAVLRDLIEQHGYVLAVADTVIDGDTVRVLTQETDGAACVDVRIAGLLKHERTDPDPVLRELAEQEWRELAARLPFLERCAVRIHRTRHNTDVQSFARKVGAMAFADGSDVATALTPIRTARVQRLRELGIYPERMKETTR